VSDSDLDVVPQESVVDSPSSYESADNEPTPKEVVQAEPDEDGPVSLDQPEPESDDAEAKAEEESDEGDEEPEVIEFDFGGNKLSVNKADVPTEVAETIDKFSKDIWADYTKKSQANAETAKTIKAREETLAKIETLGGDALEAFTRGKSIKAEIEQLSQVNMQALWQSNPDQARQLSDRLSAKQAELQSIIQAVDQYEHAITESRQQDVARRAEEGRQVLDRKYKGFSTEIAPKLEAYAVENGISQDEAATWASNPTVAEFAYKAMLYDQMQQARKPKATPKPSTPVRSMPNKGSNRQSANQNDMSFGELAKVLGL